MKTRNKKLVGGLLVGIFIVTLGVVYASGQTDDTSDETPLQIPPFEGRHRMKELGPFAYDLTDEQQTELEELTATLREQNATRQEIQAAIQEKLDEYGVLDKQLDTEIAQTEQRLTILNREKELRNEGCSWGEIRNVIEDEFDLQNTTGIFQNMMDEHGFGHGPCGGPYGDFIPGE